MTDTATETDPGTDGGSLWELVERRAKASPDALMLADERGRELTFGEFHAAASGRAEELVELRPGASVFWQLPTTIEACILAAALARRGVLQAPMLPRAGAREIAHAVSQLGPDAVITGDPHHVERPPYGEAPSGRASGAGLLPGADAVDAGARWAFCTSGTTGAPKGALHTDAALLAAARGMIGALGISSEDRHAVVFPLTHVGGIVWLAVGLMTRMPQLLVEAFRPETTLPAMRRFGVTLAGAGTAFHLAYLEAQRASPEPVLPDVRAFPGGAAPKPPRLHDEMRRAFAGAGIVAGYGLTECPILAMNSPDDPDDELAASEGRALPGVSVRVVAADGSPVAPGGDGGTVGELRVRGPQLMLGYVGGPPVGELTDESGHLPTGDLGWVDGRGHIRVTGRLKDVIIRKGESIGAGEVEDLLQRHGEVVEAAVVGLPDPGAGELVAAAVVVAHPDRPPSLEELTAFLADEGLSRLKHPERLFVEVALPRGPAGKVQKDELRRRLAAQRP